MVSEIVLLFSDVKDVYSTSSIINASEVAQLSIVVLSESMQSILVETESISSLIDYQV